MSDTTTMTAPATESVAPADADAVRAILARQQVAWNAHDMDAFVVDMTPDVDWVNVVGMHWQGLEVVRNAHKALHRMTMFSDSSMILGPLVLRQLAPDVILAVSRSSLEGMGPTPSGEMYPSGGSIMTLVIVKNEGRWKVAHAHNTNIDQRAAAHDPGHPR